MISRATSIVCVAGSLCVAALLTGAAQAQTASLKWEARHPGGQWGSGVVAVAPNDPLEIRLVASWIAPGATGAASLNLDALVKYAPNDDVVVNPVRVAPFDSRPQTIAARRVTQGIKIDDNADLGEAGVGANSIRLIQLRSDISGTNYSTSNPVTLLTFQLNVGTVPGVRRVTCVWPAGSGSDPVHQNLRLYTNGQGATTIPYTQPCDLTIYMGGPGPGPCYFADFNQDGVVDFFDYLDFVADFAAELPSADTNYDCEIDFFDYLDFVSHFAGC